MTNRLRLVAGFCIPFATVLFVWCLVLALGRRPSDLSHAATIYGGVAMSLVAGMFNLVPFYLYMRFRASLSGAATPQAPMSRSTNAGLLTGGVLFYCINMLSHMAIWWDHFTLPRIDAQEGLGYFLVVLASLVALYLGHGVGVVFSRVASRIKR